VFIPRSVRDSIANFSHAHPRKTLSYRKCQEDVGAIPVSLRASGGRDNTGAPPGTLALSYSVAPFVVAGGSPPRLQVRSLSPRTVPHTAA
jgi:hypothetical protein